MKRVLGFILLLVGLAIVQFCGVIAFGGGGGKDLADFLQIGWIGNVGGGRMPRDAMLYLGGGALGVLIALWGLVKLLRGR